jgi:phosphoribosylglycinamide formyltransferase-1
MPPAIRIGALVSGGGTNLQAIIDGCQAGRIEGKMVFVGADNPEAYGLQRAADSGIPTFVVNYRDIIRQYKASPQKARLPADFDLETLIGKQHFFNPQADQTRVRHFLCSRAMAEAALLEAMQPYPFDLLVLAGFMRNLSPYFIDRVNVDPQRPRIMNIHPALLPAFPGVDGYGDTYRYGCKVGGCTVHFIDYGEDSGPIIGQKAFALRSDESLESIKKRGLALEWELYPECIQLFARGCLQLVHKTFELPGSKTYQRTIVEVKPSE